MATKGKSTNTSNLGFRGYLEASKDLGTSFLLVIPLFVVYQLGVLLTGGLRNGVDFMSDLLWAAVGGEVLYYLGVNLTVLLLFAGATLYLRRKGDLHPEIFPYLVLESSIYAFFLGSAVLTLMSTLGLGVLLSTGGGGDHGLITSIVLSLGAGLYEETVFRLVGMGGLFLLGIRAFKMPAWMAAVMAVVLSSFVFSAVHYIGPMGDAFQLGSFLFRFFAGALLAVIFYLRGFAVAVYTHAIYDIIVMVFR